MASINVRNNNQWITPSGFMVRDNGVWKETSGYVRVNNQWVVFTKQYATPDAHFFITLPNYDYHNYVVIGEYLYYSEDSAQAYKYDINKVNMNTGQKVTTATVDSMPYRFTTDNSDIYIHTNQYVHRYNALNGSFVAKSSKISDLKANTNPISVGTNYVYVGRHIFNKSMGVSGYIASSGFDIHSVYPSNVDDGVIAVDLTRKLFLYCTDYGMTLGWSKAIATDIQFYDIILKDGFIYFAYALARATSTTEAVTELIVEKYNNSGTLIYKKIIESTPTAYNGYSSPIPNGRIHITIGANNELFVLTTSTGSDRKNDKLQKYDANGNRLYLVFIQQRSTIYTVETMEYHDGELTILHENESAGRTYVNSFRNT